MKSDTIKKVLETVSSKRRNMSNIQKVLLTLLQADGGWVSRTSFKVPNATARIRELRNREDLKITCRSASEMSKTRKASARDTFYQIDTSSLKRDDLNRLFGMDSSERTAKSR